MRKCGHMMTSAAVLTVSEATRLCSNPYKNLNTYIKQYKTLNQNNKNRNPSENTQNQVRQLRGRGFFGLISVSNNNTIVIILLLLNQSHWLLGNLRILAECFCVFKHCSFGLYGNRVSKNVSTSIRRCIQLVTLFVLLLMIYCCVLVCFQ